MVCACATTGPASRRQICRSSSIASSAAPTAVDARAAAAPELPAEGRRALVVTIQENEDASHWPDASGDDLNRPLELTREDQLVLGNPDRGIQMYHELRIDLLSDPPDQNRHGLDLSVALDDTTDSQAHPAMCLSKRLSWPPLTFCRASASGAS